MSEIKRELVVITGLSGAGRNTCMRVLEDLGYQITDNLPTPLLDAYWNTPKLWNRPVAIGLDSRTPEFDPEHFIAQWTNLSSAPNIRADLVFLECDDDVLQNRFRESRRTHPLAGEGNALDGINAERALLAPLKAAANLTIDTTQYNVHDLRRHIAGHFDPAGHPHVQIVSYGAKHEQPRNADLIIPVRFLDNPHWDPQLRPLSGQDAAVAEKIAADPRYSEFFDHLTGLLAPVLDHHSNERGNYLTIAISCTGGRHRSVFVAEELAAWIEARGIKTYIKHRDINRESPPPEPEKKPDIRRHV